MGGRRVPDPAVTGTAVGERPRLGLAANWRQFTLLVVVNAFVGAMVGTERTVLPLLARSDFGIASASAALSFLVAFGIVKALTNLAAGHFSDRYGRKPLLVLGWIAALPVAPMIIWAPSWAVVVAANVFLGINQGLTWSTTVIMKIDLAGPRRRGLALGLNEVRRVRRRRRRRIRHGSARLPLRPTTGAVPPRDRDRSHRTRALGRLRPRDPWLRRGRSALAPPACSPPTVPHHVPRHDIARSLTVGDLPSRPREQPQRRHGLGTRAHLPRARRTHDQSHRHHHRHLPGVLGPRPTRHRRVVRPHRPQTAHRRRTLGPSRRNHWTGRRPRLPRLDHVRTRHGHRDRARLPHAHRRHRRPAPTRPGEPQP